jgi:hypothetical protein
MSHIRVERLVLSAILMVAGTGCLWSAVIPGLFNTGVNDSGALLPPGSVDPHWRLVQSADAGFPGPHATVVNEGWPIAAGVWVANGPDSKWLAPQASQTRGNAAGDYRFRLTFDLGDFDPATAVVRLRVCADDWVPEVRLNGLPTGVNVHGGFVAFSEDVFITGGFIDGVNTLDVIVSNGGTTVNPTGFRAEISGSAEAIPPNTPPRIVTAPITQNVPLGEGAVLSVSATGSRPLSYQWFRNAQPLADATNAVYSIVTAAAGDAGDYTVTVTNPFGSTNASALVGVVFSSPAQLRLEPLGPSSRRSALVFSEIMYHPTNRPDGRNLEFVELYNSNPWDEDLSGWRLTGEWDFTFPHGTSIAGLGFLVVASTPADLQAVYGTTNALGGFTNRLNNGGGTLRLRKKSGGVVLDLDYSDQPPWPVAADGAGHSLVLARPSYGESDPRAWAASAWKGGSPGSAEPVPVGTVENVVINEIFAHSDLPVADFVELHNHSLVSADLSGCWLSDDPATNKYRIPEGTVLPPRGFLALDEAQLGFGLAADGETIYLVSSDNSRVLDCVRFEGQASGLSWGRVPDGGSDWRECSTRTPGTTNSPALRRDIVINEIMYHPISGTDDDQYIELFNRGTNVLNVGGWRFTDGISFTFAPNTLLAPGGYLVVAKNAARLRTNYTALTGANCVGDFGGSLAQKGERIALGMPDTIITTNTAGLAITNRFFITVAEVTYRDGGRWGRWSDGGGSSLELRDPRSDPTLAPNWADSDETAKAQPWTLVEFTGLVDNAMPGVNADQVQLFLLGPGEALVDDVELVFAGVNRVLNPGFESGTAGWFFQGTQTRSRWETNSGYNSARCLHLRASDRGEPIVNRVRAPLNTTIPLNSTVTLRARVRWLAGRPEFLMRLHGGGIEATARLDVPANPGTPGAPNSRAQANVGPALTEVTHRPVLPQVNQSIRVFARVQDSDGVTNVTLRYRLDPGTTLTSIAMEDDGTGADLLPGDGFFSALIPGQPRDTMIAFRIEAKDGAGATAQFPAEAPARECFIRVGDQFISGPFGNYRIWMTQATLNHWATRGNLSNDPLDVTCVYGQSRVIYNAGSMYAGSPAWSPSYNSPIGNICAYDVLLPGDDLMFNENKLSLDVPIRDATNQREQLMHWIADQYGHPNLYRRDVYLFVNGVRRGTIYHDTQQPDAGFLEEWFSSDPEGMLVKAAQWSEGDDTGGVQGVMLPSLERLTSGGTLKTAAYRWPWRLRAADSQLDYTNFLNLVESANVTGSGYQAAVESQVNVEDWMRMFAMNDLCSFWDAVGNPNRKNTYLYKPQNDTWRTIPWDFDVGLGVFYDPVDAPLFPDGIDPTIQRMYNHPAFVRAYWRELEFGADRIFPNPAITRILSSKHDAYRANGLSFTSPFVASGAYGLSIPDWISARRSFLQGQLATVAASFAILSPANFSTNRNVALITGTAPVGVKTILVNGVAYPIAWATTTRWTLQVPLAAGTNGLEIAGLDRSDVVITNTHRTVTVNCTSGVDPAEEWVVISEILYDPLVPESSFIELFNRSATTAFDLSDWRLDGVDFTFPPGTLMAPRSYLVVARNLQAFAQAHGTGVALAGQFDGELDPAGETLTLFRPGPTNGAALVVDRVRYEALTPWPERSAGAALQLTDAAQDNSRVSNWDHAGGWRFFSYTGTTGTSAGSRLSFYFENSGGDVLLDDVALVSGAVAGVGMNLVGNGDFEAGVLSPWETSGVATNSAITAQAAHTGAFGLHLRLAPGAPSVLSFSQVLSSYAVTNTVYTLSFWYRRGAAGTNLTAHLNYYYRPVCRIAPLATPGRANPGTATLLPYPPVWLNETQPENVTGVANRAGLRVPWIELFNAGAHPVDLSGLYLANNYTNLPQWAFPSNTRIAPGGFAVVWADGHPELSTVVELHANFTLSAGTGSVVLSRLTGDAPQILDYLNFHDLPPDWSFGAVPDGQPFYRETMSRPTPDLPNTRSAPLLNVRINEWTAVNSGFIRNPIDGNSDDWFELYNPGPNAADVGGYFLTDDLLDPFQFQVPNHGHYLIPPGGLLLVWANGVPGYNSTSQPDLFTNFQLSRNGEAIGLFASDGTAIDSVTFGPQTDNLSEGRYPDGASARYFMALPTPRAPNVIPAPPEPPQLGGIQLLPGDIVSFHIGTLPGHVYRVEFTDDLGSGTWTPLLPDLTATAAAITITDNLGAHPQRFYRVQLTR